MARVNRQPAPVYAGIDISKAELVISLVREGGAPAGEFILSNDAKGHRQLLALLRREGGCLGVVLEATSTFSLDLACALDSSGVALCVINPRQARSFASSLNLRAKTDRVDAGVLAQAALRLDLPRWSAPAPELLVLRAIMRRIVDLTDRRVEEKNRAHAQRGAKVLGTAVLRSIERQLELLASEIELLLAEAQALVDGLPRPGRTTNCC